LAPAFSPTNPPAAPDQGNLKVSSRSYRLAPRYLRVQEAIVNSSINPGRVFDAIASCAVIALAAVFTGLLYRLITLTAPLIEAIARTQLVP
jgi:hypothetical protein